MDPTLCRPPTLDDAGPTSGPGEGDRAKDEWARERDGLLELLTRQQRGAQAGMVTGGLVHDVANYVQHISGTAYVALNRQEPEEWRQALELVQEKCAQLTDLTRAFLGLLRRREPEVGSSFQLSSALEETRKLVETHARREGVEVVFLTVEDGTLQGDRRLLVQSVLNLLTNAVQACERGSGRVEVESRVTAEGTGWVRITDNGGGIPEEVRRHLFRPVATGAGRDDGHGLGLFVVRQAVRSLGGRISVETNGEGTSITLDFPLASPASDGTHPHRGP